MEPCNVGGPVTLHSLAVGEAIWRGDLFPYTKLGARPQIHPNHRVFRISGDFSVVNVVIPIIICFNPPLKGENKQPTRTKTKKPTKEFWFQDPKWMEVKGKKAARRRRGKTGDLLAAPASAPTDVPVTPSVAAPVTPTPLGNTGSFTHPSFFWKVPAGWFLGPPFRRFLHFGCIKPWDLEGFSWKPQSDYIWYKTMRYKFNYMVYIYIPLYIYIFWLSS